MNFEPAWLLRGEGEGDGYSLVWPIRGRAVGQGMVFVGSVLIVRSVSAKNGPYRRALPDDGMKICTKCNCGLLYNFRRVATNSRSRTGAERAF